VALSRGGTRPGEKFLRRDRADAQYPAPISAGCMGALPDLLRERKNHPGLSHKALSFISLIGPILNDSSFAIG
jgi:hypothetical protein